MMQEQAAAHALFEGIVCRALGRAASNTQRDVRGTGRRVAEIQAGVADYLRECHLS
jgi:hypothetical protein